MKDSKLKTYLKKPVFIFISILLIYLVSFGVIARNINYINKFFEKNHQKIITEGILQPESDIPANTIFNIDPFLTGSAVPSVIEIRKNISSLIFSSLFKESVGETLDKDIIETYKFTDSNKLSIKIKNNILWNDNTKLTTQDIAFTLNQIKAIGQENVYYGAVNGGNIKSEIKNDLEMTIKLEDKDGNASPNSAYLYELIFPIVPKHILENYPQSDMKVLSRTDFGLSPVSSGFFTFKENKGDEITLEKNINYYNKKPNFDIFKLKFYQSYDEILKNFKLKNIDLFFRKDLEGNDNVHDSLIQITGKTNLFDLNIRDRQLAIFFNLRGNKSKSVFAKEFILRNYLQNAINREELLETVNEGRIIYGPIDQSSWAFLPEVKDAQKYDLKKFKENIENLDYKLNKEGYYAKDKTQLEFTLSYLDSNYRNKIAENIQSQLKKAGVKVNLNKFGTPNETKNTQKDFLDSINSRNFEVLLTTINSIQDPDRLNTWHSSKSSSPGLNLSGWESTRVDVALSEGIIDSDKEKRKENYADFQNNFIEDVPAIYLLNPSISLYFSKHITNIKKEDINEISYFYNDVSNWEVK